VKDWWDFDDSYYGIISIAETQIDSRPAILVTTTGSPEDSHAMVENLSEGIPVTPQKSAGITPLDKTPRA
jgi:hypothetical protein